MDEISITKSLIAERTGTEPAAYVVIVETAGCLEEMDMFIKYCIDYKLKLTEEDQLYERRQYETLFG